MTSSPYCRYPIETDATSLSLSHTSIDTSLGVQHVVTTGAPTSGHVTIFLHGISGTWAEWTPLLGHCADTGREIGDCLLFDLPGFGLSENRPRELAADDIAQIIEQQVRRGGWTDVTLVGHSMGGLVALDLAARRTLPVSRLVISCGTLLDFISAAHSWRRTFRSNPTAAASYALMRLTTPSLQLAVNFGKSKLPKRARAWIVNQFAAHPSQVPSAMSEYFFEHVNPTAGRMAAHAARSYDVNYWKRIPDTIRTISVYGEKDRLVPPTEQDRFRRIVPHATTRTIIGAGHLANAERPDIYVDLLEL